MLSKIYETIKEKGECLVPGELLGPIIEDLQCTEISFEVTGYTRLFSQNLYKIRRK